MTIVDAGIAGYSAIYVDFVSQYSSGYLWQLYANRTLIGRTSSGTQRRITGQLVSSALPAPVTLVRVDPSDATTDFGALLPELPWTRFALEWSANSFPADTDHFTITAGTSPGGSVNAANVIANVPFIGNGAYSFDLPGVSAPGVWSYGVTSRDDAKPLGNPSAVATCSVTVLAPPADLGADSKGNRFTLAAVSGLLTVGLVW